MHLLYGRVADINGGNWDQRGNQVQVKGAPGKSLTFADIARAAYDGVRIPEGMEPGIQFTRVFDPPVQGGAAQGAAQPLWEEIHMMLTPASW
jgi:hypothetical protein